MWLMTNFGAFMPALRPPQTVTEGDDQTMQVRARRREHLDRLREHYLPDLGPTYEIAHSDYEFRANCTPAALAAAMVRITLDIDYVSFKHTTRTQWGDASLETAYLRIWYAINEALAPPPSATSLPHSYQPGRRRRWTRRTAPVSVDDEVAAHVESYAEPDALDVCAHDWPLAWADSCRGCTPFSAEIYDEMTESIDDALEGARAAGAQPAGWDFEAWAHVRRPATADHSAVSTRIDHSECDHAPTRQARRRCRTRRKRA